MKTLSAFILLVRHPKTPESLLQQWHELVSNCCRKQKTGLFPTIRILQISCYSSVMPKGYSHGRKSMSEAKTYLITFKANFLFVLSIFTLHGACLSFCHCKERSYSIPLLLASKTCSSALASSFLPQTFRTDIIHLSKRFSETSNKPLGALAVTFLGTDHLAALHSSLSLLS